MAGSNASFLDSYRKAMNSGYRTGKVLAVIALVGAFPFYYYYIRPPLVRREYRETEKVMIELYNKQKEIDGN